MAVCSERTAINAGESHGQRRAYALALGQNPRSSSMSLCRAGERKKIRPNLMTKAWVMTFTRCLILKAVVFSGQIHAAALFVVMLAFRPR